MRIDLSDPGTGPNPFIPQLLLPFEQLYRWVNIPGLHACSNGFIVQRNEQLCCRAAKVVHSELWFPDG
jgi:hypothetical protein